MSFTQAARYAAILKQSIPASRWQAVCDDVQAISIMIKKNKDYTRWAARDPQRWNAIINLTQHPELVNLLQLLRRKKIFTFIVAIADELLGKNAYVVVDYAGFSHSYDEKKIKDLVASLWGGGLQLVYEKKNDLIEGVRLHYKGQTFDTSFRRYRHDLIEKIRNAQ